MRALRLRCETCVPRHPVGFRGPSRRPAYHPGVKIRTPVSGERERRGAQPQAANGDRGVPPAQVRQDGTFLWREQIVRTGCPRTVVQGYVPMRLLHRLLIAGILLLPAGLRGQDAPRVPQAPEGVEVL